MSPECSVCRQYTEASLMSVSLFVSLTELTLPQYSQPSAFPTPSFLAIPMLLLRIEQLSNVIN